MRRLVTWLLDGLPFDPRSRRALDETLLDWGHEEDAEHSKRWLVGISGALAVLRALVVSTCRETVSLPFAWLVKRTALFGVLPAMLLTLPFLFPLVGPIS